MWYMKPNYWKKNSIYAGVVILISGGDLSENLQEMKQKFEFSLIPGGYGEKKMIKCLFFFLCQDVAWLLEGRGNFQIYIVLGVWEEEQGKF